MVKWNRLTAWFVECSTFWFQVRVLSWVHLALFPRMLRVSSDAKPLRAFLTFTMIGISPVESRVPFYCPCSVSFIALYHPLHRSCHSHLSSLVLSTTASAPQAQLSLAHPSSSCLGFSHVSPSYSAAWSCARNNLAVHVS